MIQPWKAKSPGTAYLYPTMLCNLKCKMCYSGSHQDAARQTEELTLEEYRKLIGDLYSAGVRSFDISGGEPFLRRELFEIIKHIKSFPDTVIYTVSNGTVLSGFEKELRENIRYIDRIYISFDSPAAEEHNAIRGSAGAFERAMEGIGLLKTIGYGNTGMNFVAMNENAGHLTGLLDLAYEQGVSYVNILRLLDVSKKDLATAHLETKKIDDICSGIYKWIEEKLQDSEKHMLDITLVLPGYYWNESRKNRKSPDNPFIKLNMQFDPIRGCPAFGNSIIINSKGLVTGCTAMVTIPELYVGDTRHSTVKEVLAKWESMQKLLREREEILKNKKPCSGCVHWNVCRGGCPASAYNYYGSIMEADIDCPFSTEER